MAAFSGKNSDEWSGPKNPLGTAEFHIFQAGESIESLKEVFRRGGDFDVVWFYEPSNAEVEAGATSRQRVSETFGPKDSYVSILGWMYNLRRIAREDGKMYVKGGFSPF